MIKMKSAWSAAALTVLLALGGCGHRDGGPGMAGMDHSQHGGGSMGRGMHSMDMAEHVDGHLAYMKSELRITPAQEPRWNAFADAMRAHARSMADMHGSMGGHGGAMTLPARLDMAERMMAMHRDEMRRIADAARPLYAALSPGQRRTADELLAEMDDEHMHGMGADMMAGPMMGERRAMRGRGPRDRVEGRLAFIRTELRITPAQEPQWNAFAAEVRAQSRSMGRMHAGMGRRAPAALPARLTEGDRMMTAHLDALRRFKAVANPLYAALSPEQKARADRLATGRGARMGHM